MPSCSPDAPKNPAAFYWPEIELFPEVQRRFAACGELDPLHFYAILDWKAPRARTRHLARLSNRQGGFDGAVAAIATGLRSASGRRERLQFLMTSWGFRLPTASAILAVLYPNDFTVYDVRVCDMLGEFGELTDKAWSADLWSEFERYLSGVRGRGSSGASLRDCDRALWGASKHAALKKELKLNNPGPSSATPTSSTQQ
jgi:hypothetical protein